MSYKYNILTGASKVTTKLAITFSALGVTAAGAFGAAAVLGTAHAVGTQVIVTPGNTQGWGSTDVRGAGAINYVVDPSSPGNPNVGALQLTTTASNTDKADYIHAASVGLAGVSELSYSTKQNSASNVVGDPSFQLPVCLGGVVGGNCIGFTTLVYEPYWNGAVTPGGWQSWNTLTGKWWSSKTYSSGECAVVNGAGGPPFYTISQLATACPDAVVTGFGVNVGSYNPSYDVEADLVDFNGTTYNFEPYAVATDKEACKSGGWMGLSDGSGHSFKNQGDCVSFVATGGRNTASTKTH